jgi:hypothetical protein
VTPGESGPDQWASLFLDEFGNLREDGGGAMRLEFLAAVNHEAGEPDIKRDVGAIVARTTPTGGASLEFGPADGAPLLRMVLTATEAARLAAALHAIASGRTEEIVITEA